MPVRVCLDTSVWLAALNDESDKDLASVSEWFKWIEEGQAKLVVPSIVSTEVTSGGDAEGRNKYRAVLDQPYVELADLTHDLAINAAQLRYRVHHQGRQKLKTPDAIIVQTAESFRCDWLLSFDHHMTRLSGSFSLRIRIASPREALHQERGSGEPDLFSR